ncbi:MAG TPA: hypothetical protein DEB06_05245 [Phycisphaerales bacterium]|nr:hypothetical protein [Phycisphaerales bacterium]
MEAKVRSRTVMLWTRRLALAAAAMAPLGCVRTTSQRDLMAHEGLTLEPAPAGLAEVQEED